MTGATGEAQACWSPLASLEAGSLLSAHSERGTREEDGLGSVGAERHSASLHWLRKAAQRRCLLSLKKSESGPGQGGSVGWRTVLCTERLGSIPFQGTCLGCQFHPRSGCMGEAADRCVSPELTFLSLPSSLSENEWKHILG